MFSTRPVAKRAPILPKVGSVKERHSNVEAHTTHHCRMEFRKSTRVLRRRVLQLGPGREEKWLHCMASVTISGPSSRSRAGRIHGGSHHASWLVSAQLLCGPLWCRAAAGSGLRLLSTKCLETHTSLCGVYLSVSKARRETKCTVLHLLVQIDATTTLLWRLQNA